MLSKAKTYIVSIVLIEEVSYYTVCIYIAFCVSFSFPAFAALDAK